VWIFAWKLPVFTGDTALKVVFTGEYGNPPIFDLHLIHLHEVATAIRLTGCETLNSLRRSFKAGRWIDHVAITVLDTAFRSRAESKNRLRLWSGCILSKTDCPEEGWPLFDIIEQLKWVFRDLEFEDAEEQAIFIFRWLPILWDALHQVETDSTAEYPDALLDVMDLVISAKQRIMAMGVMKRRTSELTCMVFRISLSPDDPPPYVL
jgi:hypothetical protein